MKTLSLILLLITTPQWSFGNAPFDAYQFHISEAQKKEYEALAKRCGQNAACYLPSIDAAASQSKSSFRTALSNLHPLLRTALVNTCSGDASTVGGDIILVTRCMVSKLNELFDNIGYIQAVKDAEKNTSGEMIRTQLLESKHYLGTLLGQRCGTPASDSCTVETLDGARGEVIGAANAFSDSLHNLIRMGQLFYLCGGGRPGDVDYSADLNNACRKKKNWLKASVVTFQEVRYAPSAPAFPLELPKAPEASDGGKGQGVEGKGKGAKGKDDKGSSPKKKKKTKKKKKKKSSKKKKKPTEKPKKEEKPKKGNDMGEEWEKEDEETSGEGVDIPRMENVECSDELQEQRRKLMDARPRPKDVSMYDVMKAEGDFYACEMKKRKVNGRGEEFSCDQKNSAPRVLGDLVVPLSSIPATKVGNIEMLNQLHQYEMLRKWIEESRTLLENYAKTGVGPKENLPRVRALMEKLHAMGPLETKDAFATTAGQRKMTRTLKEEFCPWVRDVAESFPQCPVDQLPPSVVRCF